MFLAIVVDHIVIFASESIVNIKRLDEGSL